MDHHLRESTVHPPPTPPALPAGPWVVRGSDGTEITLPAPLGEALEFVADAFVDGASVTLSRHERMVTTQEAADLLGVSRPTLVRMLDHGLIPYDQPGSHRRLRLADVLEHQRRCHHEDPPQT
ncbi:DNA binding domain-containing protein, excisionase family [Klenkia soli]|uniref:DNA binding domain-containing protein, excisionase family n=1 Tax=Klenkia soli TaxID=1052260 RepID=A0A1H0N1M9_9ACTN|nr:helix-turn-helix domain-containing protein [Klenkia soli]SDO86531.1 DNA binding domain-containing protein, excisionase family [Klenkia soli]